MRKLITSNLISLDGFIGGPGGDISWHIVNDEFNGYAIEMLNSADTLLFGRITYELMAGYWSTEHARTDDPQVAEKMNRLSKIVFSQTLKAAEWENTTLLNKDVEKNIAALKVKPGKDILILGSGMLISALTKAGLIDEYHIIVAPVILGSGVPQFAGTGDYKKLNLTGFRTLDTGVVILSYQTIN